MLEVVKKDKSTKARLGLFRTRAGQVNTPSFFPVATQSAVKGLSKFDLDEIGIEGILVNAYHLFLRPGVEVVKKCGGLHKFMGFDKTIITDSGGYQIFSLERLRKVTDKGVEFQSHIDGNSFFLTPQDVIKIQLDLDSDIIVPLDECVKFPCSYEEADRSVKRTIAWARKSKEYLNRNRKRNNLFFGIIQGSTFPQLRSACIEGLMPLDLDGICLGGLSVGEPKDLRYNMISFIHDNTEEGYLRYFMGYGKPRDIIEAVSLGIDLFDCVVPTRFGRTGTAFTASGELVVRNAHCINDSTPLDNSCLCKVCSNFSRAYIRHLLNAKEMLGVQLITYHNVFWYNNFMKEIRHAIKGDSFESFKKAFMTRYKD